MKNKIIISSVVCGLFLLVAFVIQIDNVNANPSQVSSGKSATATSTLSYLLTGTATSTTALDTQSDGGFVSDSAVLLVQLTASSSATNLNIFIQYSDDGIDWYNDDLFGLGNASSTPPVNINLPNSYSWRFMGQNPTVGVAGTLTRDHRAIIVPTPTRYVRAVFSVTGANGGVWSNFQPKKQNR